MSVNTIIGAHLKSVLAAMLTVAGALTHIDVGPVGGTGVEVVEHQLVGLRDASVIELRRTLVLIVDVDPQRRALPVDEDIDLSYEQLTCVRTMRSCVESESL